VRHDEELTDDQIPWHTMTTLGGALGELLRELIDKAEKDAA
jgi:hypothetical protein